MLGSQVRRLFSGSKKAPKAAESEAPASPDIAAAVVHVPSIPPKLTVPAAPHPTPYERIAILSSPDGLLLRPDVSKAESHVLVRWGKAASVESVQGDVSVAVDDAAIVYGIVGLLRLFTTSYLLVIDARTTVGNLLDENHVVYGVKHIAAIPLDEERATTVLNAIRSTNAAERASVAALSAELSEALPDDAIEVPEIDVEEAVAEDSEERKSTHVRFVSAVEVIREQRPQLSVQRPPSPVPSPSSSAASSGRNSPTSPVTSALAARLSFWDRVYKRGLPLSSAAAEQIKQNIENNVPVTDSLDKLLQAQYENDKEPQEALATIAAATPTPSVDDQNRELENKVVRETVRLYSKGGMYFAYGFDITTPLQRKRQAVARNRKHASLLNDLDVGPGEHEEEEIDVLCEPQATLPLWRRADKKFWWNSSMVQAFVDAGVHPYVLPIMQGYFQMSTFSVPAPDAERKEPTETSTEEAAAEVAEAVTEPTANAPATEEEEPDKTVAVDYIIVSRRSRDRAGLRYQRRGIDDDANVANFVETEAIVRIRRDDTDNVFSYTQIRGSIPLYWSQPGYSLKPAPQLSPDRTHAQNLDAVKRHLERTIKTYGPHTIVNLAEQHGKEGAVTKAYGDYVGEMGSDDVRYVEYDFHAETKGMKYENIQQLITQLDRAFESQGFFWVSNKTALSEQKGVFRVNCIDCLDRTNVVQSAFARFALHRQLEALALLNVSEAGKTDADVIFNDVWANNGDAISQAYAGTSALKGDYTRTGKRDITGMLHDGVNSLARVYSSSFSDWFSQAVIDYALGNRTLSVFTEFLRNLASTDPRELLRISKVRDAAIETCTARVLNEGERLLSGWTLFSPVDLNTRMSDRFEEKVVLLTAKALYVVSYDYNLEKVKMFTRIPLGDIVGLRKGPYILSALDETSRDPTQNYGLMVAYLPTRQDTRVSSYSIRNSVDTAAKSPTTSPAASPVAPRFSRKATRRPTLMGQGAHVLSRMLTNVALGTNNTDVMSVAFKALPVDTSKERRGSTLAGVPLKEPSNCLDAVNNIVDAINSACTDVGAVHSEFIVEKDIVSLAEAQSTTSMYAKLEYGVKRLLWLGR
ncbi:hypothetical protein EXIGLDRAFT_836634 [Exidia glandulosa HHB12029]|uniref:SAC domain-containing protein n=1 Tax=Exidia glandulosa HHB12029 TaxID=1314781 RepID=A0A165HLM8_EXIGL|nr:hypothetical protein EXIGLDRAFT_836634 [Exidia glandulosa HHB12029]